MKRTVFLVALVSLITLVAWSQIRLEIVGGGKGAIAITEMRGSGAAQALMPGFNSTLWTTINESGLFKMVPRTSYPLSVPQQPQDFKASGTVPKPPIGLTLGDWAGPPVSANYLAFGYTAIQNNQLVLYGYFYNVTQGDLANAQVIGKLYFGSPDEAGARKVALEFASDILKQFGQEGVTDSKIYFVSDRTGNKEIWSMDWDGANQQRLTSYNSITTMPAVSLDGSKIGYTTYAHGTPALEIFSLETKRRLLFANPKASMNATVNFTPDGKSIVFASTLGDQFSQIYMSDLNGRNMRPLTSGRYISVEPKVNPKNGNELVFVSGRSGPQQIYRMNIDGADITRLTSGEGEAANPAWNPNGQYIAFAWTRGFESGGFNIFIMDVASRDLLQLTHGSGRNENPAWSPDGRRIVYSSRQGRSTQIYSMLADGTQVKQLTTQGSNEKPVWGRGSF